MRVTVRLATVTGVAALGLCGGAAEAQDLQLAPIFTSNAVLQRGQPIPLSGVAARGGTVEIALDDREVAKARADDNGRWEAELPAQAAGDNHVLAVSTAGQRVRIDNIAFGDVFLCSGQSNMEFTLRHATNADGYISVSANPKLRLFNVPRQSSTAPADRFSAPTTWTAAAPDTTPDFSAACYFMGAELQSIRKVPVGLIAASWGGSIIEDWIPGDRLAQLGGFEKGLALLALRARDPAAADRAFGDMLGGYFDRATAKLQPWQQADVTKFWEGWGDAAFAAFDGTAVYRTEIQLTADQAKSANDLVIGKVDDIDQTLVNGQVVGSTPGWAVSRQYSLKPGLLHAGLNRIDVRVLDTGGGGGMWGDTPRVIRTSGGDVPLTAWKVARGAPLAASGGVPQIPWIGGSGLSTLYNGMIAPIGRYPLAGIAWYQGEANVGDPAGYRRLLAAMMDDWRRKFSTRPFVMTQLASFGARRAGPVESNWAALRDVQRAVTAADADAGMAVTIDIGDPFDIHPTQKQVVGHRLALAMEGKRVAALPDISRSGDGHILFRFDRPLHVVGDAVPIGFELCAASGSCRYASAVLVDDRTVSVAAGPGDRTVRYLWADSPIADLFDIDDTPISPFSAPLPSSGN